MSSAICFNLDQSKILLSGNGLSCTHSSKSPILIMYGAKLNLLPFTGYNTIPTFNKKSFEKIVGKRRKCWLQALPPFPHNVLYLMKEKLHHLSHTVIAICKCFQFG